MKQKLCAALLCGALMLGLAASAGAYYITADGEPTASSQVQEFIQKNTAKLDALGATPVGFDFHNGLLLVTTEVDGEPVYDYVNENAQWMNLNQGRFSRMYDFSEGLAPVIRQKPLPDMGKNVTQAIVGYIDQTGNLVIDLDESEAYSLWTDYGYFTGRFVNGQAIAIKGDVSYWGDCKVFYATIDTKGNVLTEWVQAMGMPELCKLPLYNEQGVHLNDYLFKNRRFINRPIFKGNQPDQSRWGQNVEVPGGSQTPPPVQPEPSLDATYGQSAFKSLGYTIVGNIGYLNIEVTNSGSAPDTGDLFYVLYNKYKPGYRDNTTDFLPGDYIRQIHYELAPGETTVLRAGVAQVGDLDRELTEEELNYGWRDNEAISASRYVLTQAETVEERDELIAFFKTFHYWEGFMELSFQPDANGVTILAAPGGTTQERNGLDEKLAAFTSQF